MNPDDFRRLVSAGLTTDQIAVVMEMFAERDEVRKAGQRARWRKHQENKKNANVSQRELTVANVPREGVTRVEDKSLPTEIEPQVKEERNARAAPRVSPDLAEFKAELAPYVDPERIEAVVKLRKLKRGQITAMSAKLFLKDAAEAGLSPIEAVDTCISRNWITVRAGWLAPRGNARAGPQVLSMDAFLGSVIENREQSNGRSNAEIEGHPPPPRLVSRAG